ncbi:MAG: DUF4381 domain-containing protein [Pseudomonadota bacterium]
MNAPNRPTNLVDLIDQLIEPPPPEPIAMLPQTTGWWVLGLLVLAAMAWAFWRYWRQRTLNAYRRAAIKELNQAGDDSAAIAAILRRTALVVFPRCEVASLMGEDWFAFLNRTGTFPRSAAPCLRRAPYATEPDDGTLRSATADWIRTHRRPA